MRCATLEAREQLLQPRRLRRVVLERVDHEQRAFAGAGVERTLAGERAHLLRHDLGVLARARTEHGAAAHPVAARGSNPDVRGRCPSASTASGCRRSPRRASWSTRCPGAGWRGRPSRPGASREGSPCRRTCPPAGPRDRAGFPARCTRPRRVFGSLFQPSLIGYPCLRTSTIPFFGPATEPRM